MKQILQALVYLHEKKLTHFDIKLDNILLDNECNIKLIDFEYTAHDLEIEKRACNFLVILFIYITIYTSAFCGTTNYLSPEMVDIYEQKYSVIPKAPTDMWAAGVIMYALLTGTEPFSGKQLGPELFKNIRLANYVILKKWDRDYPDAFNLIRKMLTVDSTERITAEKALTHPFFSI